MASDDSTYISSQVKYQIGSRTQFWGYLTRTFCAGKNGICAVVEAHFQLSLLYKVAFIVCLGILAPIPASFTYWNFACVCLLVDTEMVSQSQRGKRKFSKKLWIPSASRHSWPVFTVPSHSLQVLFPGCSNPTGARSVVVLPSTS